MADNIWPKQMLGSAWLFGELLAAFCQPGPEGGLRESGQNVPREASSCRLRQFVPEQALLFGPLSALTFYISISMMLNIIGYR